MLVCEFLNAAYQTGLVSIRRARFDSWLIWRRPGGAHSTPIGVLHRPGTGGSRGTEVVPVSHEGFVHEVAATQDDTVAEVADTTPQGLSRWQGVKRLVEPLDDELRAMQHRVIAKDAR